MRIAIASVFGCELSWAARLQDEGSDVLYWIEPRSHKTIGDGLIEKAGSWDQLLFWAKDGLRQKVPTLLLFGSSGLGEKADLARKWGVPVIGGGTFCDKLEKDRSFGQVIAESAGCKIPACQEFKNVDECMKAAENLGDQATYFKTDSYIHGDATHGASSGETMVEYLTDLTRQYPVRGTCILQEKIEGVPLSTARWWNGMNFTGPYQGTYEQKAFMNDNIGPSTGCSLNATWFYEEESPLIAQKLGWDNLTFAFRKNAAPPGIYDINAVVDENGEVWYLEWTPRLGYDSEPTSMRLMENLSEHLWNVANGREMPAVFDDLAYSVRLSVPPYPSEDVEKNEKASPDGKAIHGADGLWDGNFIAYEVRDDPEGEICVAGPEGIVGLSLAVGEKLSELHSEVMGFAGDLRVAGLQWRTDGKHEIEEAAESLKEAGLEVHSGLIS